MAFHFVEKINSLSPSQKLHFYEVLAHNLTVSIRGVWSDSEIDDATKVALMKLINEVAHRVTAKVWVLRLNTHEWTEEDMWNEIQWAIDKNSSVRPHLAGAVIQSYNSVSSMPE